MERAMHSTKPHAQSLLLNLLNVYTRPPFSSVFLEAECPVSIYASSCLSDYDPSVVVAKSFSTAEVKTLPHVRVQPISKMFLVSQKNAKQGEESLALYLPERMKAEILLSGPKASLYADTQANLNVTLRDGCGAVHVQECGKLTLQLASGFDARVALSNHLTHLYLGKQGTISIAFSDLATALTVLHLPGDAQVEGSFHRRGDDGPIRIMPFPTNDLIKPTLQFFVGRAPVSGTACLTLS